LFSFEGIFSAPESAVEFFEELALIIAVSPRVTKEAEIEVIQKEIIFSETSPPGLTEGHRHTDTE